MVGLIHQDHVSVADRGQSAGLGHGLERRGHDGGIGLIPVRGDDPDRLTGGVHVGDAGGHLVQELTAVGQHDDPATVGPSVHGQQAMTVDLPVPVGRTTAGRLML